MTFNRYGSNKLKFSYFMLEYKVKLCFVSIESNEWVRLELLSKMSFT